jgi:hypothetical protein
VSLNQLDELQAHINWQILFIANKADINSSERPYGLYRWTRVGLPSLETARWKQELPKSLLLAEITLTFMNEGHK